MRNFNEKVFNKVMNLIQDKSYEISERYTIFSYFVTTFESKEKAKEILTLIQSINDSDIKDPKEDAEDYIILFLERYLSMVNLSDCLETIIDEFPKLFQSFSCIFLQYQEFNENLLIKYEDILDWIFVVRTQKVSEELFDKHFKDISTSFKSYQEYENWFNLNRLALIMSKTPIW